MTTKTSEMTTGERDVRAAAPEQFLENVRRIASQVSGNEPASVYALRKAALEHFAALGFPTVEREEWRYTNVSAIARQDFVLPGRIEVSSQEIAPHRLSEAPIELVFINGHFSAAHSRNTEQAGAQVRDFSSALHRMPELVSAHLGQVAGMHDHAFRALNTALMNTGAVIVTEDNAMVDGPIHLLFITTASADGRPMIMNPRNLVVARRGSRIRLVETYTGSGSYFNNPVTELIAEPSAGITHYKVIRESSESFHIASLVVRQERDSTVTSSAITLGGGLVRNEIDVRLAGEGSSVTLDGLYVTSGTQHVDNQTVIDHIRPHCTSTEHYKGILDGRSRGIFDGKIIVRKDAQKTSSRQTNNNLVLSESATVDTKPQLEINNDDVKCSHGSTIGRLDDDALFYLRSRGLDEDQARALLTYAFASEIVERLKIPSLQDLLRRELTERLPHRRPENAS